MPVLCCILIIVPLHQTSLPGNLIPYHGINYRRVFFLIVVFFRGELLQENSCEGIQSRPQYMYTCIASRDLLVHVLNLVRYSLVDQFSARAKD
jgi:hypothetical protein